MWGRGVIPEYQGWLKRPTPSFQRPHPLHPTTPTIPKQLWRFSVWSKSYSEKAGAQNHDLKVLGWGLRGFGLTDRAGMGIGEHWDLS